MSHGKHHSRSSTPPFTYDIYSNAAWPTLWHATGARNRLSQCWWPTGTSELALSGQEMFRAGQPRGIYRPAEVIHASPLEQIGAESQGDSIKEIATSLCAPDEGRKE